MSRVVLDASALLAVLNEEPGCEQLTHQLELFSNTVMSTVNIAEAHGTLMRLRLTVDEAWEAVTAPVREIIPFDSEQSKITGSLLQQMRKLGLSLGDRACLALARTLNAAVYTADRAWKGLNLGMPIHLIR